jgi:hypothetical protein
MSQQRVCPSVLILLAVVAPPAIPDSDVDPAGIGRRISAAFNGVPGAHVRWTVRTETVSDLDSWTVQLFSIYAIDEVAWSGGRRFRRKVIEFDGRTGPYLTSELTYVFADGITRAQRINADLAGGVTPENFHIYRGVDSGVAGEREEAAVYMECIGSPLYDGKFLDVWRRMRQRNNEHVGRSTAKYPFSIPIALATGAYRFQGEESVNGIPCIVLERPQLDRMWLAPQYGYALVRREWRWDTGEPVMMRYDNSDFEQVSEQLWLPQTAQRTAFADTRQFDASPDTVHFINTCVVTSLEVKELPGELFDIAAVPGSTAIDNTRLDEDGRTFLAYAVGATPAQTEQNLRRMVEQRRRMSLAALKFWQWSLTDWIMAANLIAVPAIAIYVWRRRRRLA